MIQNLFQLFVDARPPVEKRMAAGHAQSFGLIPLESRRWECLIVNDPLHNRRRRASG